MSQTPPTATGTPNPADRPAPEASPATRPITLADLTEDLLWPRLFRAAPLALRPERLGIALFVLILVSLIGLGFRAATGDTSRETAKVSESSAAIVDAIKEARPLSALLGFMELVLGVPAATIHANPWWAALFALPLTLVLAVGGGAICRMAATEFSHSVMLSWPRALGFAISRWVSLWMSILAPLLVAGFFVLALSVGGWLLLNWPVVNVGGAILYPLFLLGATVAVLLLVGYVLGQHMLLPAMACEGTDAIDAVQRSYAYVVGRPLRLILYSLVLGLQLAVMTAVLGSIALWVVSLAEAASTSLTGDEARRMFAQGHEAHRMVAQGAEIEGTWKVASRILAFWTAIPMTLVGAFVLSYLYSGSTILYLLMRQLNDGQDPSEIWMPGMVGGTMAQATGASAGPALEAEGDDD